MTEGETEVEFLSSGGEILRRSIKQSGVTRSQLWNKGGIIEINSEKKFDGGGRIKSGKVYIRGLIGK